MVSVLPQQFAHAPQRNVASSCSPAAHGRAARPSSAWRPASASTTGWGVRAERWSTTAP